MSDRKPQRDKILGLLVSARGAWVPLPEIAAHAMQYNSRLHELRAMGFQIQNKTRYVFPTRKSVFRHVNRFRMFAEMVRALMQSDEAKPEASSKPAEQLEAIPPCPYCGAEMPTLLDNRSTCCRQYLRSWFDCAAA